MAAIKFLHGVSHFGQEDTFTLSIHVTESLRQHPTMNAVFMSALKIGCEIGRRLSAIRKSQKLPALAWIFKRISPSAFR